MLKAIKDSSRETNDAYDKLRAGYWRLWKLGALKGFDEIRICLFRLILSSFESLSADGLTCILQDWVGSDRLYDCLLVEEIESLYSNFLVSEVVSQHLRFTHSSAREFVVREILAKISGVSQESPASSTMKENHRSIAQLFVNLIQRFDSRDRRKFLEAQHVYRYWNALGYVRYAMSKCEEEPVCRLLKIAGPVAINELD